MMMEQAIQPRESEPSQARHRVQLQLNTGNPAAPGELLVRRFELTSLVLTLLATVAVTYAMGRLVEAYLLDQVVLDAERRLERVVLPALLPEGKPVPRRQMRLDRLDEAAHQYLLIPPIRRVAVWDGEGSVLY